VILIAPFPLAGSAALVCAFGLAIGSFLNVVVHRVPAGMSVVSPASACPVCGHAIRGRDNVPVLSWFTLRGRCRDCGTAISSRYPLVEAATALLFLLVGAVFVLAPWSPLRTSLPGVQGVAHGATVLAAYLFLMAVSVALALIDIDTHTLPNRIVLPTSVVLPVFLTLAAALADDWGAVLRGVIGLLGLACVYLALALAVPGGMGLGDVKLAGVLGFALAYLGWGPLAVGSFGAFFLGGIFSIVLLVTRRVGRRTGIPFGPWMLGGAWLGIFFGAPIWAAYLGVLGVA